jgi:hypothetical protein
MSRDYIGHPLEEEMKASARQILDAVSHGFRTKVDVKGKVAELLLKKDHLDPLVDAGILGAVTWHDSDGEPDFELQLRGRPAPLRLECKNVRSGPLPRRGGQAAMRIEIQKTRNSKDGSNTRSYRLGQFELLAACLFNQTGRWEYLFARAIDLARGGDSPDLLKTMQPVTTEPVGSWTPDLARLLRGFASE